MIRERRSRECRKWGAVSSKEVSDVCARVCDQDQEVEWVNAFLILEIVVVLAMVYIFLFFLINYVNLVPYIYMAVYISCQIVFL